MNNLEEIKNAIDQLRESILNFEDLTILEVGGSEREEIGISTSLLIAELKGLRAKLNITEAAVCYYEGKAYSEGAVHPITHQRCLGDGTWF